MSIPNPKYVSELNELAKLCTDSAETYRRAVDVLESPRLAAFCKQQAEDREMIAGQFRVRVDELGQDAEEGGTVRTVAEKVVSEIESLFSGDGQAILSELIRVDGHLKERFEALLQGGVPPGSEGVIETGYRVVKDGYRALTELAANDAA